MPAIDGLTALEDVSLRAAEGDVLELVGPNGSDKTTLINTLTVVCAAPGRVRSRDTDLLDLPPERIVRIGLIRTFQTLRVFRRMTVLRNLLAAQNGMPGMRFADLVGGRRRDAARRARAIWSNGSGSAVMRASWRVNCRWRASDAWSGR